MATKTKEQVDAFDPTLDAGAGFEGVGAGDMAIPFLTILQDLSPQVKKQNPKFVKGAESGMIFNTLTNELYQKVQFIPCAFQKLWVEWKPRTLGGGFVKAHGDVTILQKTTKNDKNRDVLENGNEIVTTAYHFGILAESQQKVIIAMTSTQLKKSRKWLSVMSEILAKDESGNRVTRDGRPVIMPTFSNVFEISTELEQKSDQSWFGWSIKLIGPVREKGTYLEAKGSNQQFKTGGLLLTNAAPPDTESTEEAAPY